MQLYRVKLSPQQQEVLEHLLTHDHLTPLEATFLYRVRQLATVVFYLKEKGFNIVTTMKTDSTGRRYARYALVR